MIKIGLTGSIGMGKTTTAGIFVKHGCALWDADKTVHKLYSKGGIAVKAISELFPTSVVNGSISRNELKVLLKEQPEKLKELEKIVHHLIQADRQNFLNQFEYAPNSENQDGKFGMFLIGASCYF